MKTNICLLRHAMFVMQELFEDFEEHDDDITSLHNFIVRAYCFECDNAKRTQEREDDYDTFEYDENRVSIYDEVCVSIFDHVRTFYKTDVDVTDEKIEDAIRRACCSVCCQA